LSEQVLWSHTPLVVERGRERAQRDDADAVISAVSAGGPRLAVPEDIRDVSFHSGVRGYDRRQVDRYVQRVNRVIAELEMASSPQSAVRHALDRVGEQTSGILHHARETADEIVRTARAEAEDTVARAKDEASDITADARAEADKIAAEAEAAVGRANTEAGEIVANATKQAEAILLRADSQIVERRAREEQRLEEIRLAAEEEMKRVRAEIDALATRRSLALDEVGALSRRLQELVASNRPEEEDEPGAVEDQPGVAEDEPGAVEDEPTSA
jgi:DivIVA domain-containing protein